MDIEMSTLEIIFASLTLLFAAICAFAIIGGVLYFIFKLYSKIIIAIKKVDIIGDTVESLLIMQAPALLDKYKKATASLYNPQQPDPDRDILLTKLESGTLLPEEANRLEQILKWEEAEARRRNLQVAGVAIGGVLLLLYIFSKQQQR